MGFTRKLFFGFGSGRGLKIIGSGVGNLDLTKFQRSRRTRDRVRTGKMTISDL